MWNEFTKFINKEFNISLTEKQILQFKAYLEELINCNTKFNLTAIREPEKVLYLHFADSLAAGVIVGKSSKFCSIVDIGSGAGFPGLPLKIAFPEIQLTIIESVKKKALFIDYITRKLKLKNLEILNCRAEELTKNCNYNKKFDFVLFRAVTSAIRCVELAAQFIKKSGQIILWQSKQSINKVVNELQSFCHYEFIKSYRYVLPVENRIRYLTVLSR